MDNDSPIYNSRNIDNYVEYLQKHYPKVDAGTLLKYAGIEPYEVIDEGHWLTQKQVNRFHEKLNEVVEDPEICRKVGRFSVNAKAINALKRYALKFITPQKAFSSVDKLYPRWSRGHRAKTKIIGKNSVEVVISTQKGVKEEPFQCKNRTGIFEAAATLFVDNIAQIEHPDCMHKNARHCRYLITFDEKKSARWHRYAVRFFALFFLVITCSFAFVDFFSWSAITIFGAILNLGLYLHANNIEVRELKKAVEDQGDTAESYIEETRLRYNHAMLIQEIGKAVSATWNISEFLNAAAMSMEKYLDFKRCVIFYSKKNGRILTFSEGYGISKKQISLIQNKDIQVNFAQASDPFVKCIVEQKPFLANDISIFKDAFSSISRMLVNRFNIQRVISVPIVYRKKILGLIVVDSPEPERTLTKSDLGLLYGLAAHVATGVVNVRSIRRIRESEEKYRLLAENVSDIIWILDIETLTFKYISPSNVRTFGYTAEETMQMPLDKVLTPESFTRAMESLGEVMELIETKEIDPSLITRTFEIEQYAKNGDIIPAEISTCLLTNAKGKPINVLGTTRDISRRKAAEKESRDLEDKLRQSKKMESLGVMAGSIAHNFNNLLMVVLGNLEIAALDLRDDTDTLGNVNAAAKAAKRASDLSTMMLTYVGQLKKNDEAVDLKQLVMKVVSDLKDPSPASPEIVLDLSEDTILINADPKQIRQVLMGLITNATESITKDGGIITVSLDGAYRDKDALSTTYLKDDLPAGHYGCIKISDNGCGMDAETLQKIFDPYFSTKFTGRGLGLAAALGIIRSHNGAITVDSSPGKGSSFRVMFPQINTTEQKQGRSIKQLMHPKERNTILLVDDEALVIDIGRQLILRLGFNVITAGDGREALDVFLARKDEIAFTLLDLTMPVMDGIEAFREMKKIDGAAKIIITSGYTQQQIAEHFEKDNQPTASIQKPFSIVKLKEKLLSAM